MKQRIAGAFLVLFIGFVLRFDSMVCNRFADDTATSRPLSDSTAHATHHLPSAERARPGPEIPTEFRRAPLAFLSTAPVDSLILLPGIGPVIAERLASARTGKRLFTRWEDLLTVKGIGPKKLQRLKTEAAGGQ